MFKERTMVDIETLSTQPNATIISIGAVKFTQKGLGDEFYKIIRYDDSRHIDPATQAWWNTQSEEAKLVLTGGTQPLREVVEEFKQFLGDDTEIWGNGSDFDNVILADAFKQLGFKWNHRANRCYRTLKSLHPGIELKRTGVHHNALDDAKSQALHAIEILNYFLGE